MQHPLCDANGFFYIVKAYCNLLEGQTLQPLGPRMPLKLREENVAKASPRLVSSIEAIEAAATRHKDFFANGWTSLLVGGLRQHKNRWGGPTRREKTVMNPNFVIDKLVRDAETTGVHVTKHDLLMSWIYQATMPEMVKSGEKTLRGPPQFSFVMNVGRMLQHNPKLHNPWLVIPIPVPKVAAMPEGSPILHVAGHIRSVIVDARRLSPIQQIVDQHKSARTTPLGPADWGCREPNVVVSSWTNLPLYELEFPSAHSEIPLKPVFVQCGVKVCPMLRLLGLAFDDGILTWKAEAGFWIQGNLDEKLWERISDFSSFEAA